MYCALSLYIYFMLSINAQTVSLSGPTELETGECGTFTATVSGLPSGAFIRNYKWKASFITPAGPSGISSSVAGQSAGDITRLVFGLKDSIPICWGDGSCVMKNKVFVTVEYQVIDIVKMIHDTLNINIRRIGCGFRVSGFNPLPACCALQNIPYDAVSFGDSIGNTGYTFSWSLPSYLTLTSPSANTPSIRVNSDINSIGSVCVTVARTGSYSRTRCLNVTRSNLIEFSASAPKFACAGQILNYSISGIACSSNRIWTVPSGWNILSGQGSTSISVQLTANAQSGDVSISYGTGSCVVSKSIQVTVLQQPPPVPVFRTFPPGSIDRDGEWRDGFWRVCPTRGTYIELIPVVSFVPVESYTFSVSPPWTVNGQSGSVTVTDPFALVDGPLSAPLVGTLSARTNNCFGSSAWASITFFREEENRCEGKGGGKTGGKPLGSGNINSSEDISISTLTNFRNIDVFPVPFTESLHVRCHSTGTYILVIIDMSGNQKFSCSGHLSDHTIETADWPPGVYLLMVKAEGGIQYRKIIK